MKKYKLLLLLFVVIFLSGCSGVYEITINKDLSITEEVNFSITQKDETYDKVIELLNKYDVNEEDYSIKATDSAIKVSYKKNFDSIEDYILNSKLYPSFVNDINYSNDNGKLDIEAISLFSTGKKDNENIINNYDIDLLRINIQTSLNVIENNADESAYDVYTWNIKNGDSRKNIKIEIGTESFSNSIRYILLLVLILGIVVTISVIAFFRFRKAKKI